MKTARTSSGSPADAPAAATATTSAAVRRVRPLRGELVHGIGPWTGAAVLVTVLIVMNAHTQSPFAWPSRRGELTELLRGAGLVIGGPLSAAAGCWHGGRERRRRTLELRRSFARGGMRQALVAAAPAALWPAVGYLLAAAVPLLATWPYSDGGLSHLALPLADALALAALGVLGFVAGRLVPWRLTAPLAAVMVFLLIATVRSGYGQDPSPLNPADVHDFAWDRPVWWFAPASAGWLGGLAAAALLLYAARRRATALVPLTVAVGCAAALVSAGPGLWRPDPGAARLVCDDGTPQVCVTAVDRALLPAVSAALADLNDRLRGLPGAPVRWVDGPRPPTSDEAQLPSPGPESARGRLKNPQQYGHWAVQYLFSETCEPSDHDPENPAWRRASDINSAVIQWLSPPGSAGADPLPETREYVDRLNAKPPAGQRDYLARYLTSDTCRADQVPVP
ncbi:hypothetical protein ACFYT4_29750 [Streptomyces sp. NPDC004609]|uniref:hypothetical protein n=1 Tax=Streptomyces sp. NPDC004609 TaxID=3364704 RepID=UPI0036B7586E